MAARVLPLLLALAAVPGLQAERPVMKVVRLLQDMAAELSNELADDKAVHEALTCWCTTNDREKAQAIELGQAAAEQLKSAFDESTAKVAQLKAKRKATLDEVFADQKALGEATALRMKENKAFHAQEADLMEAVAASKQAVVVLGKHHPELAQVRTAVGLLRASSVTKLVEAPGRLRRDQLEALEGFLSQASQASQAPSFLSVPGFESYAPQSGQIFGILQQLQSDFEASLESAQKGEAKAESDYQSLKAAKESEISSGQNQATELDAAVADFDAKAVAAAKELEDTQAQLALDTEFLGNLKSKCSESDAEFQERVKSRLAEISAVQDAIQILNSETAFDNFGKTVNSVLLQTSSVASREALHRQRAAVVLRTAAVRTGAPQLALLAASAQLDTFEKVTESIDKLVVQLATQQKDEVAHRDWCIDDLAQNDRSVAAADDKLAGLKAKIADLQKAIESVTASIASSKAAQAEIQAQMKRVSENREAENADYQQTIIDQHLTQEILKKTAARLSQVYGLVQEAPKPGAAHIETSGTHTDPGNGPARFTKYEENAGGARVLQLLSGIIADSVKTEAEARRSEADSQTAYESFIKDSNKSLLAHLKSVNDLSGEKARAEESLTLAKSDLRATFSELEGLDAASKDLHGNCDYIMKNFETRQAARTAESEALKEAKAILSGMQ